jgi:HEAT repeat protein
MKGAERVLEKARRDDDQWVVKNAADQALESRHHTQLRLQPPAPQPEALDWLIEFAAKIGLGIAPGKGALEMLRRVLNEGSPQHKVAALEAIGWFGLSELKVEVINALRDEHDQVRQAAYECYRWLVAMGQRLAERTQPAAPAKPSRSKA